jgi:hypothetical protein
MSIYKRLVFPAFLYYRKWKEFYSSRIRALFQFNKEVAPFHILCTENYMIYT